MGFRNFRGGLRLRDGWRPPEDKPVRDVRPGETLVYPMEGQHQGAAARPVVRAGDRVLAGQRIGEAAGRISAYIACSVSGRVRAVEKRRAADGSRPLSVVVENDGRYETVPGMGERRDWRNMSPEEIRAAVREAGVVGMGGAGFPTDVKLASGEGRPIDAVIANGMECEPFLASDLSLMFREPERVIGGLKVVLRLFPRARGVIALEDSHPALIRLLTAKIRGEERISVLSLPSGYPRGSEGQLVRAVTGRELRYPQLPTDVGCIVDNVATLAAVYMAVCECTPLIRRIVTVAGDAVASPCCLWVRTGTRFRELTEYAGGLVREPEKLVCGGPMMGRAMVSLDTPVTKISSALLCLAEDEVGAADGTACIRCGRCVSVCPSRLIPQRLFRCVSGRDRAGFERLGGMECLECGACSWVCPARLRLTQAFQMMRREGKREGRMP